MSSNSGHPVIQGQFAAVAPVVADGDPASARIDSDAILFVKGVGPAGAAHPAGQETAIAQGAPAAAATWNAVLNTLPLQVFRAAAPALVDGQGQVLRCDATGRLLVSTIETSPSRYSSAGDATDGQIGAVAARTLVQIFAHNAQAAANRFLMLFDAAALPVDGTVPYWSGILVPPGTQMALTWDEGLPFAVGIHWASSTTRATLTVAGAADMNVSAVFR